MKLTRHKLLTASLILFLFWFLFVVVLHLDGDIIFTSELGLKVPPVRQVSYFLPRGDSLKQSEAQGQWFGGDVIYVGAPKWVLLLPCPKWIGSVGGKARAAHERGV